MQIWRKGEGKGKVAREAEINKEKERRKGRKGRGTCKYGGKEKEKVK